MDKKLNGLKSMVAEGMDFPREILVDIPKIIITGEFEVVIENHKGIVAFDNDLMKINTSLGLLNIKGDELEVLFIGGSTIIIGGKFKALNYGEVL
ncbi:MAG: sporulation protein YqfC [Sarcina sp.]